MRLACISLYGFSAIFTKLCRNLSVSSCKRVRLCKGLWSAAWNGWLRSSIYEKKVTGYLVILVCLTISRSTPLIIAKMWLRKSSLPIFWNVSLNSVTTSSKLSLIYFMSMSSKVFFFRKVISFWQTTDNSDSHLWPFSLAKALSNF